jgi:hypothetical protein
VSTALDGIPATCLRSLGREPWFAGVSPRISVKGVPATIREGPLHTAQWAAALGARCSLAATSDERRSHPVARARGALVLVP